MLKNYKVSIIVPVFNGENFIKNSIENLLKQTYENIEIILINDGSTDNTFSILSSYSINPKIKVFNNTNHGVSYSRNFGITKATGEYVMFVDADDELFPDAVEKISKYALQNPKVDIIRYNGYEEKKDGTRVKLKSVDNFNNFHINKKNVMNLFISGDSSIRGYCWLLFLKRKKIIKFKENLKYMEDTIFCIENILNSKSILFVDEYVYLYKYNTESVTKKIDNILSNAYSIIDAYKSFIKIFNDVDRVESSKIKAHFIKLIARRICLISRITDYNTFKDICIKVHNDSYVMQFITCDSKMISDIKIKIQYLFFIKKWFCLIYIINKLKK